ncbi:MAG: hypothetical protein ACJAZO_000890 [Myxococcota bacterium]|jgi:hypothetical protein
MTELTYQLQDLLADRHTQESRALFELLLKYVNRRVRSAAWRCCRGVFGESELDEIVSDVLLQLMTGALARFRGETTGEMLAFVRTVADRSLWRAARKVQRERKAIHHDERIVRAWNAELPSPEALVRLVPDSPLSDADETYLRGLLAAGSKVAYARETGVSRAAVTQRVKRIQTRIAKLADGEQMAVDAWLHNAAHEILTQ